LDRISYGKRIRRSRPGAISDYRMLQALRKSSGVMSEAAKLLGVSRNAVWKRVKASKRLQMVLPALREQLLDGAEGAIWAAVKRERDNPTGAFPATSQWVLKSMGRDRGWGEKITLEVVSPQLLESLNERELERISAGEPLKVVLLERERPQLGLGSGESDNS
jgi:hypothetical protein